MINYSTETELVTVYCRNNNIEKPKWLRPSLIDWPRYITRTPDIFSECIFIDHAFDLDVDISERLIFVVENLLGKWTMIGGISLVFILFELEEDAVAFKLRW
jgi:hypothetical protein